MKYIKKYRNLIDSICDFYKVKMYVLPDKKGALHGHAHPNSNVFCMSNRKTLNGLLSSSFHEIGHCIAFRNGKFIPYHNGSYSVEYLKRYAYKAELYVDKWAEKEFYKMFPNKKYQKSYRTKKDKIWLMKYYLNPSKKEKCYDKCYPEKHKLVIW